MGNLFTKIAEINGPGNGAGKPSLKKIVFGIGFLCLLVFFLVRYMAANREAFLRLRDLCLQNLELMGVAVMILMVIVGLNGLQFNTLMRHLGRSLPVWEWLGLAAVTHFYNLFMPLRGGMAIRAWYLKKKHNFSYAHFAAIQGGFQVIVLMSAGVMGLVGMGGVAMARPEVAGEPLFIPIAVFFALSTAFLGYLLFARSFLKEPAGKGKWRRRIWRIADGWDRIRTNRWQVGLICVIALGQREAKGVLWMVIFYCLGVPIGLSGGLFLAGIGMFSMVIMVLPGNLGVEDAVTVFSAHLIGVPLETAVAAALLARMLNMAAALAMGPISNYLLFKRRAL